MTTKRCDAMAQQLQSSSLHVCSGFLARATRISSTGNPKHSSLYTYFLPVLLYESSERFLENLKILWIRFCPTTARSLAP